MDYPGVHDLESGHFKGENIKSNFGEKWLSIQAMLYSEFAQKRPRVLSRISEEINGSYRFRAFAMFMVRPATMHFITLVITSVVIVPTILISIILITINVIARVMHVIWIFERPRHCL